MNSLRELIVSQTGLRSLKLGNINPNLLFPALATQSKTLTSIHLLGCTFNDEVPWTYLIQCSNIEKLKFRDCTGFSERMTEALTSSVFPRLKLLAIVGECKTLDGDYVTKDYCEVLIKWGIERGALVTVGVWDFVDAWVKFETSIYSKYYLILFYHYLSLSTFIYLFNFLQFSCFPVFTKLALRVQWTYAGQFHNIYRKYLEAFRHANIFQVDLY